MFLLFHMGIAVPLMLTHGTDQKRCPVLLSKYAIISANARYPEVKLYIFCTILGAAVLTITQPILKHGGFLLRLAGWTVVAKIFSRVSQENQRKVSKIQNSI